MSNKVKIALIMAISGIIVAIISSQNTPNNPPDQISYGNNSQNIQTNGNVTTYY